MLKSAFWDFSQTEMLTGIEAEAKSQECQQPICTIKMSTAAMILSFYPPIPKGQPVKFSAWDYARKRSEEIDFFFHDRTLGNLGAFIQCDQFALLAQGR
jgi:hypothetical protein